MVYFCYWWWRCRSGTRMSSRGSLFSSCASKNLFWRHTNVRIQCKGNDLPIQTPVFVYGAYLENALLSDTRPILQSVSICRWLWLSTPKLRDQYRRSTGWQGVYAPLIKGRPWTRCCTFSWPYSSILSIPLSTTRTTSWAWMNILSASQLTFIQHLVGLKCCHLIIRQRNRWCYCSSCLMWCWYNVQVSQQYNRVIGTKALYTAIFDTCLLPEYLCNLGRCIR